MTDGPYREPRAVYNACGGGVGSGVGHDDLRLGNFVYNSHFNGRPLMSRGERIRRLQRQIRVGMDLATFMATKRTMDPTRIEHLQNRGTGAAG